MSAAFTSGYVQLVEDKLEELAKAYLLAVPALAAETIHIGLCGEERADDCIEVEAAQSDPDQPWQIQDATNMNWNVTVTFRARTHHDRRTPATSLAAHRARVGKLCDAVLCTDLLTLLAALAATAVGTGDNGVRPFAGHFGQRRRRMDEGTLTTEQDVIITALPVA